MRKLGASLVVLLVAASLALAGYLWLRAGATVSLPPRLPGQDGEPTGTTQPVNPVTRGQTIPGPGRPAEIPGAWPGFRGPRLDGVAHETGESLARRWPESGPAKLWSVPLGEGYAGPAVWGGCVYVMDYDAQAQPPLAPGDVVRCLSLADGRDIWRFAYPVKIKRNHGMSRTIPAVTDRYVVALGPKCHLVCLDRATGRLIWTHDLVREYDVAVPEWYAGQCPLIDGDRVIVATGGPGPTLLVALDLATGVERWRSENPRNWKMTHASITPMEVAGRRTYVYPASGGVVGVAADTGAILWSTEAWRISIATVPSPVVLPGNRVLMTGGYDAGALVLEVIPGDVPGEGDASWSVREAVRYKPSVFASTQQTPICADDRVWAVRPDGRLACLSLDGKLSWTSPGGTNFGLGPLLLTEELIFVMDDGGTLTLAARDSASWKPLARAKVLSAGEAWGPMALVGGRLLVRDFKTLVCLWVGQGPPPAGDVPEH